MSEDRSEGDVANESIPDESTDGESAQEGDESGFVNRAARRAKGKSGGKPAVFAKGKAPVGRGAVQSPRQYGARRSG